MRRKQADELYSSEVLPQEVSVNVAVEMHSPIAVKKAAHFATALDDNVFEERREKRCFMFEILM